MKLLLKILGKVKNIVDGWMNTILRHTDQQYRALESWNAADPHHLRRSSFNHLHPNSVVLDLGGYEGQWSSDIFARYLCNIYVFEPVSAYFNLIQQRFEHNPKIACFQFGLSDKNYTTQINIGEFASSTFSYKKKFSATETITIKAFADFVAANQITTIDLLKVNIEGGEYDLLDHLLSSGYIANIHHLLIQFHNFVPQADTRRAAIKQQLNLTHRPIYEYDYVWELWALK